MTWCRLGFNSAVLLGLAALAGSATSARANPEPRTAAAVIAVDEAWGRAEVDGDVAALEALLLPSYQTVSADGRTKPGSALIEGARARGGRSEARAKAVADWKATHPSRPIVAISGDTAILTWVITSADGTDRISSSDIFVYVAGRWRAAYSQHSSASL